LIGSLLEEQRDVVDEALLSIIKRRAKPRVLLLDDNLEIAFAEADAMAALSALLNFPKEKITRLPHLFEEAVRRIVERWEASGSVIEQLAAPTKNFILRVSKLSGAAGSFIAVFLEERSRREDLAGATRRYNLTRRELQVLTLILGGLNAAEIAENLHIAETTVSDYFKHLLKKTNARNRADMLAKVLGWDGGGNGSHR